METTQARYIFYSDPLKLYSAMLSDIEKAKEYIYLETYRFGHQEIGQKFRYHLLKKCKEGIDVKILVDSWGSGSSYHFFQEIIQKGGSVRVFKKMKITFDALTKHHRRNHRKILVIDNKIGYIGSANITDYCINWRESTLRLKDEIAKQLKRIFLQNFEIYNKYFYDKRLLTKTINSKGFEIIRDVPSTIIQPTRKKFKQLIASAKEKIIIETPYFLPGKLMRKALKDAGKRGVKVHIILPKRSDVGLVDILRSRYLGRIYEKNINIYFYIPQNLHAKVFLVDDNIFFMGSSNFDYRSFRFQHEVNILGNETTIISQIKTHIKETLAESLFFDYEYWKKRSAIQKLVEILLLPFRHFF